MKLRLSMRRTLAAVCVLTSVLTGSVVASSVTAPASATTSVSSTTLMTWTTTLLSRLNRERYWNGVPPVISNPRLRSSAHAHNLMMARYNTMSHQLPGEPSLGARITATGYPWLSIGENVAWNSVISLDAVISLEAMMYYEQAPNDGHRLNILNRSYKQVGLDLYLDLLHGKIWLTEDFGQPSVW